MILHLTQMIARYTVHNDKGQRHNNPDVTTIVIKRFITYIGFTCLIYIFLKGSEA